VRIALFITCVADTLFPEVGQATVRLLERLGHEVVFPAEQTCCGQMHLNSGYRKDAEQLGRRFKSVFGEFDAVVSPSSSCVGTVRTEWGMSNVFELSELLVQKLGVENVGARFRAKVAYHPTCHSLRAIQVGDAPLRLLRNVRGLELVEHADPEECCGFGGTFALKNSDTSSAMLEDKCAALEASGARWCTALDSSCLLHIGGGLSRRRSPTNAIHLAEILAST
jgi:L-lactate dehydrogenase complex protein LldE